MLIKIDDNTTIADIQDRFAECFPGLKLEFFRHPHKWNENSLLADLLDPNQKLGNIRKEHAPAIIEIRSQFKAGETEELFKTALGLFIQIYFRQNNQWVQTIHHDKLSLEQLSRLSQ